MKKSFKFSTSQQIKQIQNIKCKQQANFYPSSSCTNMVKVDDKYNQSIQVKIDESNETFQTSTQVTDKSYDCQEGFQDFSYDSDDFEYDIEKSELCPSKKGLNSQEKNKPAQKPKQKDRKIRTTITKDRLEEMNKIFKDYQEQKDKGKNTSISLKQIGARLQLGYSTILHKFRQFRQNKVVKGGALLQSLQKKRKYGKSKNVQKFIQRSLRERPFYTAVELSKYINRQFHHFYSRSIISRHLTEMGYSFNNNKKVTIQKNTSKYIQARRLFATILQAYDDDTSYIFIDEIALSKNLFTKCNTAYIASVQQKKLNEKESDYVSLIVSASHEKIHFFQIKNGFLKKEDFIYTIKRTNNNMGQQKKYHLENMKESLLLTDTHRIHYDDLNENTIGQTITEARMKRFFLPPGSPQLNPLEGLFGAIQKRLPREKITDQTSLRIQLEQLMKVISKQPTHVYFKEFRIWLQKARNGQNF